MAAAAFARGAGLCTAQLPRPLLRTQRIFASGGGAPGRRQHCQQVPAEPRLTRTWQEDGIRNIVLNNPLKRNALSLSMISSLREDVLRDIESTDLRVIIISGILLIKPMRVMTLLPKLPVPVIAKVNGLATAAGCQLVASCDIAVASEKSRFATPGVNVGLFCSTPGVALGRSLPRKVAMEMLLTGEAMTAQEALLHGLISKVVSEDKLEDETLRIARRICESSRPVVALGKSTFYKQMEQDIGAAYRIASRVMVENLALQDGQEGIKAFVSKRKPAWSHS
ncbi:enoyl-CoA hydratase domain-containing protein 3, mitochondrial isoform X3 [Podarcis raffonei]|uniref:enoyl-CoA hydratase domain-containing protein 3, mitochondrial isoform X3 n=1 Tax=Podarcis raffonei TaxID=65483 RepID=UPI0023294C28|nr:enoyl-CoA hydratase domain-containing protein 3, mitochondrial isoform X3 [Podarcis raffonei]